MVRSVTKLIRVNIKNILKFELIYKLLTLFIFSPLFTIIFKGIMKSTGYSYLTIENIIPFFKTPQAIIMIFFLLLFMMIYSVYEMSVLILIIDASKQGIKIDLRSTLKTALFKMINLFKPTNIGIMFLVFLLIPLLNLGMTSSFISVIKVPEYIMDFIKSNYLYLSIYIVIHIIMTLILFRLIYAMHYITLEKKNFIVASKKSKDLGKNRYLKDFIKIIITEGLIYLSYIIFALIGVLIIVLINHYLRKIVIINTLLITLIWMFLAITFILFNLISVPITYASISHLFYKHKEDKNEEIITHEYKEYIPKENRKRSKLKIAVIILFIISGFIFTYAIQSNRFSLNIEYVKKIEVTAHRGASVTRPENTMSAFKEAKKLGADWIELDVQQTKDGEIIVIHDSNLKRITGLNKNVWEVDYYEISKLDAGSFFNKKYKNERIPLLKDVILWAKENNMKLNIEIKPTGHEKDFEEKVVNIIDEFNFKKYCVITSQKYSVIENIKKLDKTIKTIYVMSIAYGDITKLDKADIFSIEATNVSKSLVKKVHNEGKELLVWTVNDPGNADKMIKLNVDNIITDDIKGTKEEIENSKTSNLIYEFINFIEDLL